MINKLLNGKYSILVEDRSGIRREVLSGRNMITNAGLAMPSENRTFASLFEHCVAGNSSASNFYSATGNGRTMEPGLFTCDGPQLLSASAGDTIKMTSGSSAGRLLMISSVLSSSSAAVVNGEQNSTLSPVVSEGQFQVHATSRSTLAGTQVAKSAGYGTRAEDNATIFSADGTVALTRTLVVPALFSTISVAEIGLTPHGGDNPQIFARIVLPSPVNVQPGQKLLVKYTLTIHASPVEMRSFTRQLYVPHNVSTVNMQERLLCCHLATVQQDGTTLASKTAMDPGGTSVTDRWLAAQISLSEWNTFSFNASNTGYVITSASGFRRLISPITNLFDVVPSINRYRMIKTGDTFYAGLGSLVSNYCLGTASWEASYVARSVASFRILNSSTNNRVNIQINWGRML